MYFYVTSLLILYHLNKFAQVIIYLLFFPFFVTLTLSVLLHRSLCVLTKNNRSVLPKVLRLFFHFCCLLVVFVCSNIHLVWAISDDLRRISTMQYCIKFSFCWDVFLMMTIYLIIVLQLVNHKILWFQ